MYQINLNGCKTTIYYLGVSRRFWNVIINNIDTISTIMAIDIGLFTIPVCHDISDIFSYNLNITLDRMAPSTGQCYWKVVKTLQINQPNSFSLHLHIWQTFIATATYIYCTQPRLYKLH